MKVKTTLNLDADLIRRVRVQAARLGKRQTEVDEDALRRGLSAIEGLRVGAAAADDDEMRRVVDRAVHDVRHQMRR
jgi:plasmid stability protein